MESSTKILRRLLDERGVEYDTDDEDGCEFTEWVANGLEWEADSRGELVSLMPVMLITPEQAIAATLGAGTCKLERADWDDGTCTWGCICTACDAHLEHETGIGYNFCPICGAKVVAE